MCTGGGPFDRIANAAAATMATRIRIPSHRQSGFARMSVKGPSPPGGGGGGGLFPGSHFRFRVVVEVLPALSTTWTGTALSPSLSVTRIEKRPLAPAVADWPLMVTVEPGSVTPTMVTSLPRVRIPSL